MIKFTIPPHKKIALAFALTLAFMVFMSCSGDNGNNWDDNSSDSSYSSQSGIVDERSSNSVETSSNSIEISSSSIGASSNSVEISSSSVGTSSNSNEDLSLGNAVVVNFNGNDAVITNPNAAEVNVNKANGHVTVTVASSTSTEYNLVIKGTTTNGSLKIYGDFKIAIYLNGVNITNPSGPALNIQNGKRIAVNLVGQTQNYLTDGFGYLSSVGGEDAKGTFFSEGQLIFSGSGSLEVKGKNRHAIVSDDYITIKSGHIKISEAEGDGIHANDNITIEGGTVDITSKGDAIQSERFGIIISGGKITAKTSGVKSHGTTSAKNTSIRGNAQLDINISGNGSKGIRSAGFTEIQDNANINIVATGGRNVAEDGDESNAAGIKTHAAFYLDNGNLTIKSIGDKAKGISVNGNFLMYDGIINIEADDDGIKVDMDMEVKGGSGTVKSIKKKAVDCTGTICKTGSLVLQNGEV